MVNELDEYIANYSGVKASVEAKFMTKGTLRLVMPLSKNKILLNMGLGNAIIAKKLDSIVKEQIVIEGSDEILKKFKFKSKNTNFVKSFFEDYDADKKFDIILANHVLEHVENPVAVLINMKNFLNKSGIIFITVPNANSIHRLIGVEMSLLENKYQLNTSDIKGGHQRVYDFKSLTDDIKKAGLTIKDSGGYNLKMISLTQMKDCPQELLDAIFTISQSMPIEICTNLWVTCKNNGENI